MGGGPIALLVLASAGVLGSSFVPNVASAIQTWSVMFGAFGAALILRRGSRPRVE